MSKKTLFAGCAAILIATSHIQVATAHPPSPDAQAKCNDRMFDAQLDRRAGKVTEPVSKVFSPFTFNTPYGNIKTGDMFRDLAGYYCDSINGHSAIYLHSDGLTVVSSGYEKSYKLKDIKKALADYERIIKTYKQN